MNECNWSHCRHGWFLWEEFLLQPATRSSPQRKKTEKTMKHIYWRASFVTTTKRRKRNSCVWEECHMLPHVFFLSSGKLKNLYPCYRCVFMVFILNFLNLAFFMSRRTYILPVFSRGKNIDSLLSMGLVSAWHKICEIFLLWPSLSLLWLGVFQVLFVWL